MQVNEAFFRKNPAMQTRGSIALQNGAQNQTMKRLQKAVPDETEEPNEDALSPDLKRRLEELKAGRGPSSPSAELKRLAADLAGYMEQVNSADEERSGIISRMSEAHEKSIKSAEEYREMLAGERPFDFKDPPLTKEEYELQGPHSQVTRSLDGAGETVEIDYDLYKLSWDAENQSVARKEIEEQLVQEEERIKQYPAVQERALKFFDSGTAVARSMIGKTLARMEELRSGGGTEKADDSKDSALEEYKKIVAEQLEKGELDDDGIKKLLSYIEETGDEDLIRIAQDRMQGVFGIGFEMRA